MFCFKEDKHECIKKTTTKKEENDVRIKKYKQKRHPHKKKINKHPEKYLLHSLTHTHTKKKQQQKTKKYIKTIIFSVIAFSETQTEVAEYGRCVEREIGPS